DVLVALTAHVRDGAGRIRRRRIEDVVGAEGDAAWRHRAVRVRIAAEGADEHGDRQDDARAHRAASTTGRQTIVPALITGASDAGMTSVAVHVPPAWVSDAWYVPGRSPST